MTLTKISRRFRRRPQLESLEGRTLLSAGALDTTFGGTGQVVTVPSYQRQIFSIVDGLAVQADLKTVVAGQQETSQTADFRYNLNTEIVRYNVDGSLDTSFGNGGVVSLPTATFGSSWLVHQTPVAIQPNGNIVVATNTTTYTYNNKTGFYTLTSSNMMVLRLNPNGSLDTSFGNGGEAVISIPNEFEISAGVAVLPSGQIVVAGTNPGGVAGLAFVVARLTTSGVLDTTFGPGGHGYNNLGTATSNTVDPVQSLGIDSSGNILVGGYTNTQIQSPDQVVRFTSNGLLDTTFASQGVFNFDGVTPDGFDEIAFQPDGHIILGLGCCMQSPSGPGVLRLNANGSLDTTFGSGGSFGVPNAVGPIGLAVQPDGKIVFDVAPEVNGNTTQIQVDRLLPGGTLDPAFGTGGQVVFTAPGSPNVLRFEGLVVGPDGNMTGAEVLTTSSWDGIGTFRLLGDPPVTGQLVVTQQPPASLSAGTPFGLTVEAEDSSGNLESSFNGTVTVALANNPGGATLGGTLSVTASQGVATFSALTLTTAASGYTLVVTSSGLGETVTSAITVSPLAASQLVVTQQPPATVTAGTGFALQAAIEDSYGNVETGDNTDVVTAALAANPTGTTLGGTLSAMVSQGVASFSGLTLTTAAAGYTLGLSTGTFSATTGAITVTPAAATQLVITQQPPASVVVNSGFGLQTAIEDAYGNVVTTAGNTVKVALASNPTGAKLGGTLSVKASQGVPTFSGLTLNKVGTGYTLQLSSSGLSGAVTNAITVTKTSMSIVLSGTTGTSAPDPLLAPLALDSPDFLDSVGFKKRGRWA